MENKVYYGEYTLKHWIDLILKKNIILPEYQRYFVWDEDKVKTLIDTFRKKRFVPPITIGAFKNGTTNQNLIIDGQQRLTSILLAYLGLYPDVAKYKGAIEKLANESNENDNDDEQLDNILEWTLKELTRRGKTKEDIIAKTSADGTYKTVNFGIDDNFLRTTFLGFSYLVPETSSDDKTQQEYYSSVFRNINIQGQTLLSQESRESLYYLDRDLKPFFAPTFCKGITAKLVGTITKFDFVRYLSLLSQYKKDNNTSKVAQGYKPKMEKYYEEYIYSVVSDDNSKMFGKFSENFQGKEYNTLFEVLERTITELEIPKQYSSIIDLDMYFFGLIYEIVFEKNEIDCSKKDGLKKDLNDQIAIFKENSDHTKAPGHFRNLRDRIAKSSAIYANYRKQN